MTAFIKEINPAEIESCGSADLFLQSDFWGEFKGSFGWTTLPFNVQWFDDSKTALLVLCQRLAPGISFAYIPWGPELPGNFPDNDDSKTKALEELALLLKKYLPKSTAFLRIDAPWYNEGADLISPVIGKPFITSSADIQPPDTVIINLSQSEEEIIAAMKAKWRYNSRLAVNRGVKISRHDEDGLEIFYKLLKETSFRNGIALRSINYYKTLCEQCKKYSGSNNAKVEIRLYLAEHEGESIAGIFVLLWKNKATYLYGASSNTKKNLMAPYALQVKAMLDAKASGCVEYDLFGIPPNDDPNHPMAGLYLFKTGFGGTIIHRPKSHDFVYRSFSAGAFRFAESLRKKIRDSKKKKRKTAE